MTELKGNLVEYNSVCAEIYRLTQVTRKLKKRKAELELKVCDNLDRDNHKGVNTKAMYTKPKKPHEGNEKQRWKSKMMYPRS